MPYAICQKSPGIRLNWRGGFHEKTGLKKDVIQFQFYRSALGGPLSQNTNIPKPIFPIFQRSNIPIGAKPLTWNHIGGREETYEHFILNC
jgi:hypothetical protein